MVSWKGDKVAQLQCSLSVVESREGCRPMLGEKFQLLKHMQDLQIQSWKHYNIRPQNLQMTLRTCESVYHSYKKRQNVRPSRPNFSAKLLRLEHVALKGCKSASWGPVCRLLHTEASDSLQNNKFRPLRGLPKYRTPFQSFPTGRKPGALPTIAEHLVSEGPRRALMQNVITLSKSGGVRDEGSHKAWTPGKAFPKVIAVSFCVKRESNR